MTGSDQSTLACLLVVVILDFIDEAFERFNSKIVLDGFVADIVWGVDNGS